MHAECCTFGIIKICRTYDPASGIIEKEIYMPSEDWIAWHYDQPRAYAM